MNRIAVLCRMHSGHSTEIARRVASDLRIRGFDADEYDLDGSLLDADVDDYAALIVAGSVQSGAHDPDLVEFVREGRRQLGPIPSALISVTLGDAASDTLDWSAEAALALADESTRAIGRFIEDTGWRPLWSKPVIGAIRGTGDGAEVRLIAIPQAEPRFGGWVSLGSVVENLADDIVAALDRLSQPPAPAPS